ncbi:MAG: PaaI family thioesterase [Methanomicrobiales archaeon]|nr:PaaI family thioesterase [Methanomicrobiales archaeon]
MPGASHGEMTYLERIRSIGRDANPFFTLMGVEIREISEGKAEISMKVRPDMTNGVGWLQGGIFTALADEAMALALYTLVSREERIVTISESTSFIRGAREGTIVATGYPVRRGRRVAFMEGEVRSEDRERELLARTSATFLILSPDR